MDVFRVRLNCIDHYQATPTKYDPQLRNDLRPSEAWKEPRVPVIRVFGSTETGQKVCAHIHGAFPYLFVEYQGPLDKATVGEYIYRLHGSIDHALASARHHHVVGRQPRYVARITLAKGVPFYGYHVGYRFYLKIYMLNPNDITRLAELLQAGVIMGHEFQPFEAHLKYIAQFMCDFNLFGCGYIETDNVFFRAPVPQNDEADSLPGLWDSRSTPPARITDDHRIPRASKCSIEVDICVKDILNRRAVRERRLHHDFIEKKNPLPADLKLVHSMAGLWEDETRRRKRRLGDVNPGSSVFPPEALVSMSADPRRASSLGWVHEEELREELQRLVEAEGCVSALSQLTFPNFVEQVPHGESINTVSESVEDMFPENLLPALGLEEITLTTHPEDFESIEVDEQGVLKWGYDPPPEEPPGKDAPPVGEKAAETAVSSTDHPSTEETTPPFVHEERPRTINGLSAGVLVSGLAACRRPKITLPPELLADAHSLGVLSKLRRAGPPDFNEASSSSLSHEEDIPRRKRKLEELDEPPEVTLGDDGPAFSSGSGSQVPVAKAPPSKKIRSETSKASQSSQLGGNKAVSARDSGSQPLNFPVVKDPQSLSTLLRLSQKNASQSSQDSPTKKQVMFDPLLVVQEKSNGSAPSPTTPGPKTPLSVVKTPETPETPAQVLPKLRWNGPNAMFFLNNPPPTVVEVLSTLQSNGLPDVIYQDAFYSKETDVPPRSREYAGREYRLDGNSLPFLPDFDLTGQSPATFGIKPDAPPDLSALEMESKRQQKQCTLMSWEIADPPPAYHEVKKWWEEKQQAHRAQYPNSSQPPPLTQKPPMSQIAGTTPRNKHNFKYSQRKKSTSVRHEVQYMSTMSLELHVNTRGKLLPNPEEDEIQCIFWCLKSDEHSLLSSFGSSNKGESADNTKSGIVVLSDDGSLAEKVRKQTPHEVAEETSELDVMIRIAEIVRTYDPDILTGYEVHGSSWGYLIERASIKYDYDLCDDFSRMKSDSHGRFGKEADRWGFKTSSTLSITGRHMINIWRAMRGELNLLQYSMENIVWHLLHRRIPHYSWRTLTDWYVSGRPAALHKVLRYYQIRTRLDLDILDTNELVPRTSEQARLLGIDFFSVISRGSQFKVESIMFRIAKPENFLLISPGRKQVGGQNALECLPLVMEPQSAFYSNPVLVLDFQSLYPSVMIAYNYCYSTFLGRIVNWRGANKMGFTEYKRRDGLLRLLKDYINIAPNGMMYTKPEIRKSLLAKMLTEILETRIMVKSGMKQDKDDKTLQQLLNNRQLALKLLANVTYGYTSASFSGRMPCSEIADSIVQTGRETLERAIAYIHSVERWGADVVYGDTDSLFIHLKGRTREQAFDIGAEIAKEITDMNPRPIKLKFEKVYQPCVLLAKKRYVGYKYETRDQAVPEFDDKGIETVRRDGTPVLQMILEKAIRVLFETADLSQVKSYFQEQMTKIMRGDFSIQDFCMAQEVKLGSYSAKGTGPPGAAVATRRMAKDPRAEPQYGERVPYLIIAGAPNARVVDRAVPPEHLLADPNAVIDTEYYISKHIIPPLERIFNLMGANVRAWYDEVPKVKGARMGDAQAVGGLGGAGARGQGTIERFMRSASCVRCQVQMASAGPLFRGKHLPICKRCAADAATSMVVLQNKLNAEARRLAGVVKVCQTCAGMAPAEEVTCDSMDCPVLYTRRKDGARSKVERGAMVPVIEALGQGLLDW
ncbi:hypothetical protein B0T18DRAFT_358164 [Schizothecium vesticola]|uniref:DNA polymerase n=1 Tax=Schizothecium vesticola TaxID=314040 RepID=A0AA40F9A6_9PEZI|nr:hypothetical protein B0T18DRAFT_358164 [Schizothecium vesticola]